MRHFEDKKKSREDKIEKEYDLLNNYELQKEKNRQRREFKMKEKQKRYYDEEYEY